LPSYSQITLKLSFSNLIHAIQFTEFKFKCHVPGFLISLVAPILVSQHSNASKEYSCIDLFKEFTNYLINQVGIELISLPVKLANKTANIKHKTITITNNSNENISPLEKGLLFPIELAILESAA